MADKKEKILKKAQKLAQQGRYEAAVGEYEVLLKDAPNDINILNTIGDLYSRAGKIKEAVDNFIKIGEFYTKEGFYARSIAVYKKITKIDPKNNIAYYKLAELYLKEGIPNEAREALIITAQNFVERNQIGKAKEAYEKILEINPDSLKVRIKLADIYEKENNSQKAVEEYLFIGKALLEKTLDGEAQQVFEKIIKVEPNNLEAANNLVEIYTRSGNNKRAITLLTKISESNPDNLDVMLTLGKTYYNINEIDKAAEVIQKVMEVRPKNPDAVTLLAKILLQKNQIDQAFDYFLKVIDIKYGDSIDASTADVLKPIFEKDPYYIPAIQKLVDTYKKISDVPNLVSSLDRLGLVYKQRDLLDSAREVYEQILDLDPENKKATLAIADLQEKLLERIPRSEEGIDLDKDVVVPGDIGGQLGLGTEEMDTGKVIVNQPQIIIEDESAADQPFIMEGAQQKIKEVSAEPGGTAPTAVKLLKIPNEEIYEIEILIKYGLLDKARDRLLNNLKNYPNDRNGRKLLRDIYLEKSDMVKATMESLYIAGIYASEGNLEAANKLREDAKQALTILYKHGSVIPPEGMALIGEGAVAAPPSEISSFEVPAAEAKGEEVKADVAASGSIKAAGIKGREEYVAGVDLSKISQEEVSESPVEIDITESREDHFNPLDDIQLITEEEFDNEIEIVEEGYEGSESILGKKAGTEKNISTGRVDGFLINLGDGGIEIESEIEQLLDDSIAEDNGESKVSKIADRAKELEDILESELKIDDLFTTIVYEEEENAEDIIPVEEAGEQFITDDDLIESIFGSDHHFSRGSSAEITDDEFESLFGAGDDRAIDVGSEDDLTREIWGSAIEDQKDKLLYELEEVDFYIDQEFFDEAKAKLQVLQGRYPGSSLVKDRLRTLAEKASESEIKSFKKELGGFRGIPFQAGSVNAVDAEIDNFFDKKKGSGGMHRELEPIEKSPAIISDEDLFKEEEEFFRITSEIEDQIEIPEPTTRINLEAQLESIFDEFKEELSESLSEDDYETRYNLGIAYKEMDLIDEAIVEFQASAKSEHHMVDSASMLGYCFIEKNMASQAIQWFKKALIGASAKHDESKIVGLKMALADAFALNQDAESALRILNDVYEKAPDYPGIKEKISSLRNG